MRRTEILQEILPACALHTQAGTEIGKKITNQQNHHSDYRGNQIYSSICRRSVTIISGDTPLHLLSSLLRFRDLPSPAKRAV